MGDALRGRGEGGGRGRGRGLGMRRGRRGLGSGLGLGLGLGWALVLLWVGVLAPWALRSAEAAGGGADKDRPAPTFAIEGRVELPSVSAPAPAAAAVPAPPPLAPAEFSLTLQDGSGSGRGPLRAFLKGDGSFTFLNVPEGTHILSVLNGDWIFAGIRLEVGPTGTVRAYFKDSGHPVLEYPFVLRPVARPEYYVAKSGGQLLGMLRSPYALITIVGAVFAFGGPALMDWSMSQMSDEEREEFQKQMKSGGVMSVLNAGEKAPSESRGANHVRDPVSPGTPGEVSSSSPSAGGAGHSSAKRGGRKGNRR